MGRVGAYRAEFADSRDKLCGGLLRSSRSLRDRRLRLDEVTPGMRPAAQMRQAVGLGNGVIDLVTVAHPHRTDLDPRIQRTGLDSLASGRIVKQSNRRA
jgi:hypothetical protein